ncbi:MAG: hypothetical protein J5766_03445, partial [Clostridia bacterium]|nr:hypothetical protein [Clostridia bacterium]
NGEEIKPFDPDSDGTEKDTDKKQWTKDKKTLEKAGYKVELFTNKDTLSGYETALKVDKGSLVAYIETTSPNRLAVFYFKSAALASAKFESYKDTSNKFLKGSAIIIDDKEGILTGEKESEGTGGEAQMKADAKKLESLGFRVDAYTTGLSDYETSLGAKKWSLAGYLKAFKSSDNSDDSILITGYYFGKKSDAKKYVNVFDNYVLVDYAIIRGDKKGYITRK